MRALLADMTAGLLFFAVLVITNDIYKATVAGVVFGVVVAAWIWSTTRRFELMQLVGLGLVLVMGSATILFHDPRFVMYKPTLYYACAGLVMLKRGWMSRYLPKPTAAKAVSEEAARASRRYIEAAGIFYCVITLAMALANTVLAMYAPQKTWALFNAAAAPAVYSAMGMLLWMGARKVRRSPSAPITVLV